MALGSHERENQCPLYFHSSPYQNNLLSFPLTRLVKFLYPFGFAVGVYFPETTLRLVVRNSIDTIDTVSIPFGIVEYRYLVLSQE